MLLEFIVSNLSKQRLALIAVVPLISLILVGWLKPSLLPRHVHVTISQAIHVSLEQIEIELYSLSFARKFCFYNASTNLCTGLPLLAISHQRPIRLSLAAHMPLFLAQRPRRRRQVP